MEALQPIGTEQVSPKFDSRSTTKPIVRSQSEPVLMDRSTSPPPLSVKKLEEEDVESPPKSDLYDHPYINSSIIQENRISPQDVLVLSRGEDATRQEYIDNTNTSTIVASTTTNTTYSSKQQNSYTPNLPPHSSNTVHTPDNNLKRKRVSFWKTLTTTPSQRIVQNRFISKIPGLKSVLKKNSEIFNPTTISPTTIATTFDLDLSGNDGSLIGDDVDSYIQEKANAILLRKARVKSLFRFCLSFSVLSYSFVCFLVCCMLLFCILVSILYAQGRLTNFCNLSFYFNGGNQNYIFQRFHVALSQQPFSLVRVQDTTEQQYLVGTKTAPLTNEVYDLSVNITKTILQSQETIISRDNNRVDATMVVVVLVMSKSRVVRWWDFQQNYKTIFELIQTTTISDYDVKVVSGCT